MFYVRSLLVLVLTFPFSSLPHYSYAVVVDTKTFYATMKTPIIREIAGDFSIVFCDACGQYNFYSLLSPLPLPHPPPPPPRFIYLSHPVHFTTKPVIGSCPSDYKCRSFHPYSFISVGSQSITRAWSRGSTHGCSSWPHFYLSGRANCLDGCYQFKCCCRPRNGQLLANG